VRSPSSLTGRGEILAIDRTWSRERLHEEPDHRSDGAPALAVATVAALGTLWASARTTSGDEGPLRELAGASGWLNSVPLLRESLRGKVVLANFWTYTCINSLRPLPCLRAWAERYKDAGLVVVGVHSPEFSVEKESSNVAQAVHALNVAFPVALDSDYRIWEGFDNHYWPALYFFDAKGRLRHRQFGEGRYDTPRPSASCRSF
jgi:thiol-disulfide isomerase/thioredoxin